MNWKESALRLLSSRLHETFTAAEAVSILSKEKGFSDGTTYRLVHDLASEGSLLRLGRGLYRFPRNSAFPTARDLSGYSRKSSIALSEPDKRAKQALESRGVRFVITGPSILYPFSHHLQRRTLHLIYVEKGAGEEARDTIKRLGFRCLLRPTRGEVSLALAEFLEDPIVIIRETSYLKGEADGVADLERALIDTYFESTRRRIPFPPEELGRMLSQVLEVKNLNVSHLLMMARKRGIVAEIRALLKEIQPELKLAGPSVRNSNVEKVLAGVTSEAR